MTDQLKAINDLASDWVKAVHDNGGASSLLTGKLCQLGLDPSTIEFLRDESFDILFGASVRETGNRRLLNWIQKIAIDGAEMSLYVLLTESSPPATLDELRKLNRATAWRFFDIVERDGKDIRFVRTNPR